MKFKTKYKLNLHKRYFDLGYGFTSYLKYFIAFIGLASRNVKWTMIIGVAYAISCYIFGWAWIKFGWYEAEIEVNNKFNKFVKEMRKSYNNRKI